MIILIKLSHKKNNYISLQSSVSKCVYCRWGGVVSEVITFKMEYIAK